VSTQSRHRGGFLQIHPYGLYAGPACSGRTRALPIWQLCQSRVVPSETDGLDEYGNTVGYLECPPDKLLHHRNSLSSNFNPLRAATLSRKVAKKVRSVVGRNAPRGASSWFLASQIHIFKAIAMIFFFVLKVKDGSFRRYYVINPFSERFLVIGWLKSIKN